jgi:hypothetical protein
MSTQLTTHNYITFLHGFEDLLASTKFIKEWRIQRNDRKEIEIMIIVDESYVPQDLYNLYYYAQVLGSMAVCVQNFPGAHCYIRDQKSKNKVNGFDDISFEPLAPTMSMRMDDHRSSQL